MHMYILDHFYLLRKKMSHTVRSKIEKKKYNEHAYERLKFTMIMCFYTDRNLHGFILNQFPLVPMLWNYEASPCSDAFSLRTLSVDLWPVRSMVSCSGSCRTVALRS